MQTDLTSGPAPTTAWPDLPRTSVIGRNLCVLDVLATAFRLDLQGICARTGLAKPTAHRILATLVDAGLVAKDGRAGEYRLTGALSRIGRGIDDRSLVLDAIKDGARDMTLRGSWPIAVSFLSDDKMVVAFSTRKLTTRKLKPSTLNEGLPLDCAMGQAALTSLSRKRCDLLLDGLASLQAHSAAREALAKTIEAARLRGFGLRLVGRGGTVSIAVGLNFGGPAIGAVVATVFEKSASEALIASLARDLEGLRAQALLNYRALRPDWELVREPHSRPHSGSGPWR